MIGTQSGRSTPLGMQVQGVGLIADDDRVAGVVAALVAHDVLDPATEQVGGLSFALIAPLGSDEHDCWHVDPSLVVIADAMRFESRPYAAVVAALPAIPGLSQAVSLVAAPARALLEVPAHAARSQPLDPVADRRAHHGPRDAGVSCRGGCPRWSASPRSSRSRSWRCGPGSSGWPGCWTTTPSTRSRTRSAHQRGRAAAAFGPSRDAEPGQRGRQHHAGRGVAALRAPRPPARRLDRARRRAGRRRASPA